MKSNASPADRRRRLLLAAACAALFCASGAGASERQGGRSIEIGVIPYMPTVALIARHQPLQRLFEDAFKRPVVLSTATDFESFQQRALRGDFDLMIMGPGPGWQVHVDRKYPVVAVSKRKVRILFVIAADSPLRSIAEMRGKTLATIAPLTVGAQVAAATLREHKLQPGVDVKIHYEKQAFNCVEAVAIGDVAMAAIPSPSFASLPAEVREKVRVLRESEEIPGILFLVRPTPDGPTPAAFQAVLMGFAESAAGQAFLKDLNHDGLLKPDYAGLRSLNRFVPDARQRLAQPR